jgi:hypothetical protein
MRDYCFFNTIYMTHETPEWKHSIVIPIYMKGGKQRVENYSVLNEFYKI